MLLIYQRSMPLLQILVYIICLLQLCTSVAFDKYRLPKNIQPTNYNLNIKVNPEDSYFIGKVQIGLKILNGTTNTLFLHADHDYIIIKGIQLNGTNCNYSIHHDVASQIFPVQCSMEFRSGQELIITYTGKFSKEMNGFYKSTYEGKILVATQFQPIYARRAFPCFDEPSFKAPFEITVEHPSYYQALANTPREIEITKRNYTVTQFQKTPNMSSYLVAVVISQMQPAILRDQEFNVFARPSAAENMGIAKKYGQQLFDCMSQWTGIRYEDLGNPQQYLVAIPDFGAGAMENWGLITFRELDLLDDGNRTSSESFQLILIVMGHEIAHQWFGNYVTLDWWSNTWLNEGFANYFGKVIADMVMNGTLEIDKQSVVDVTQRTLEKDAVSSSTPLSTHESDVKTTLEINLKFDEITYQKGESILRMISHIMGEKAFRIGLQKYLIENKYKNTNPQILLKALQSAAGAEITNFEEKMHNWIYEPGFPLLTVSQKNDSAVTVTQKRFCISKDCNSTTQWFVPISYTTGKVKDFSVIIKNWLVPNKTLEIEHDSNDWLILNIKESGFYRVNYDNALWDKIINALNKYEEMKEIDPLNRAQIIDDIFQMAKIGKVSYQKAFGLAQYLVRETGYYPWVSATRSFSYLVDHIDLDSELLLKKWLLKLIKGAFLNTSKNTTHIGTLTENLIVEHSCKLGNKKCLSYARKQFLAFKNYDRPLIINQNYLILCYGLVTSDTIKEDYNFLLNYLNQSTSYEQFKILSALGCIQDKDLLTSYLNLTLIEPTPIRQQDFATVFNSVYYNNKMGIGVALDFMQKNFKAMEIAYGEVNTLSALMLDIAEKVSSNDDIQKMKNLLEHQKDNENIKLKGPSIMDIINSNQMWKTNYEDEIKTFLEKQKNSGHRQYSQIITILYCLSLIIYTHTWL